MNTTGTILERAYFINSRFKKIYILCLHIPICWVKISFLGIPELGEKQWRREKEKRKREIQC